MFNSLIQLNNAIREFELNNNFKFVVLKKEKGFGDDENTSINSKSRIRYEDSQSDILPHIEYNGVPFIIVGRKVLACHQGKDQEKGRKEKRQKEIQNKGNKDHNFVKKRSLIQPTKKKNCPAKIRIRHVIRFPDFKIDLPCVLIQMSFFLYVYFLVGEISKCMCNKFYERDAVSGKLKQILASESQPNLNMLHQYSVSFPVQNEHENHLCGESASMVQPLDDQLKNHLRTMVWEHNISTGLQMRILLEVHLKETLFKGEEIPTKTNKRFWPSKRDLQNHIALAIKKQRNSNCDQEIVAELVQKWRGETTDRFFLRIKDRSGDPEDCDVDIGGLENLDDDEEVDDEVLLRRDVVKQLYGKEKRFLYVHQTEWQSRLLLRYGQEISLLDATYRTTRYSLPLYFLCVPTNIGYINVATFITETENGDSIKEALNILKEWNQNWSPQFFMCDYAEEEINALESVFPDSFVYLCDFHREQSWDRWLSASHNGMTTQKADVLKLLRGIAKAMSEEEFLASVTILKQSSVWAKSQRLQNWLGKKWLKSYKRWVRDFRLERFNVSINTNNGIERQNLALKYEYLDMKKARTLSQLLTILVNKYLPDAYTRYKRKNIESSHLYRKYDESIPDFLHNRPKFVVQHCLKRWLDGQNIPDNYVDKLSDNAFLVKSSAERGLFFEVCLQTSDNSLPSCQCMDWNNWHLPCKHFMAVFFYHPSTGWNALPDAYKSSPFLTLDVETFPSQGLTTAEADINYDQDVIMIDSSCEELPLPKAAVLKRARTHISGILEIIKGLAYQVKDVDVLNNTATQLMDVMSSFKAAAPQEDGIVVDKESNMCHIATTRLKKTPRSLKLRKRRLVASKRHGVGAEKRRQYHTRKGVEDLLGVSCENMITTEEGVDLLAELHTEDPPCNESTTKPTMLLEKFKGFVSTLTAATLERYTMSASSLSSCDLNMSNRIGGVVLSEYCDSSMDTADLLMSLQSALPPTQLQLPDEVIFTLVCLILDQMEQNGDIQIFQEKHPKQLEKESAEAFRGLIECLKDMKSKAPVPLEPVSEPSMQVSEPSVPVSVSAVVSFGHQAKRKKKNVTFSKEAIQKKRIVISEDKTSAFPGGGLQNLPGQNLCFADSLLQCLRLKDFHKILLQHTCSELGCFICQLRNFIEEGPLSTEVLCGNMKEFWPDYAVGQQHAGSS
ncbi:uncharacterized protein LOC110447122 [Mizuhopecten yessoensis]|uniref:uncharacterized protein LOC110447122 n=1 Tax=Mizuhopecten yessoensis TaxID=6573 RepID=UPI000B457E2D|nr:uncharacterized protein LOC110447122 [Mizuhopecten yessoensis]